MAAFSFLPPLPPVGKKERPRDPACRCLVRVRLWHTSGCHSSRPAWKKKQQQEEQETEEGEGEGLLVHLTPNDYSRLSMNITDATVRWASSLFKAP